MPPKSIGELRHRVTIQRYTETLDGGGGRVKQWADYKTVWAKVQPLSAREYLTAHQNNMEITHLVIVRFTDIMHNDRLRYNNRILTINAITDEEERHKWLTLICWEGGFANED